MKKTLGKRFLSTLLALVMVLGMLPATVFAAEAETCTHHTEHTAECGYVAHVHGSACTHVHDEACGYVEAVEEVLCECADADEDGIVDHAEGCGYVAPVEGADCTHTHDETCGYVEAVEGVACGFDAAECAECAAEAEAQRLADEQAAAEQAAAEQVAEVQAMIDALSTDVPTNEDEYYALEDAIVAVDDAMAELTTEQSDQLDYTNYVAARDALAAYTGEDYSQEELAVSVAAGGTTTLEKLDTAIVEYTELYNSSIATPSRWAEGGIRYRIKDSNAEWTTLKLTSSKKITLEHGKTYEVQERYTRVVEESFSDSYYVTFKVYHNVTATVDSAANAEGAGKVTATGKVYHNEEATVAVTDVDGYKAELYNGTSLVTTLSDTAGWTYTIDKATASVAYTVKYVSEAATEYNVTLKTVNGNYGTATLGTDKGIKGAEIGLTITPKATDSATYSYTVAVTNGSYADGKVTVAGTGDVVVTVTFSKSELEVNSNPTLEINGYHTTTDYSARFADIKKNILNAVLKNGYTNIDDYNLHIWIDPIAGGQRYFDYDDDSTLGDYNLLTVTNPHRFPCADFGDTVFSTNLKVKIIDAQGRTVETTIAVTEWRKAATITPGSIGSATFDNLAGFLAGIKDNMTVVDRNNNNIDKSNVTVSDPVKGTDGTYTVTAQVTAAGPTWLPSEVVTMGPYTFNYTQYTVTFVDEDGTELYRVTLDNESTPVYAGEKTTAELAAAKNDAQYTWTFAGWSPAISALNGADVTYAATYTSEVNKYTITWVNGDETTTATVAYGTTYEQMVEQGIVPTASKTSTAQYHFTNGTWGEIATVTGNATYTATFTEELRSYTITWVNGDETTTETYKYGETPTAPAGSKTATAQYTYTFTGWSPEIVTVTGAKTYTAQFSSTVNKYDITWVIKGETTVQKDVEYGTQITHDDVADYTTDTANFYFKGWKVGDSTETIVGADLPKVTGHVTITAVFSETAVYKVNVDYAGGKGENSTTPVESGSTYTIPANPTRSGYRFDGWYANDTLVEAGDAITITAATTIEAKWVKTYTVTYKTDYHTAPAEKTYDVNTVITIADLLAMGDTTDSVIMDGWYIGTTKVSGEYTVTGDVTITAKWVADVDNDNLVDGSDADPYWTVKIENADGTFTTETNVLNGESYATPVAIDKDNAIFVEWTKTVDEDAHTITFTAVWNTNDANNNNVDDGDETAEITVNITGNGTVTLAAAEGATLTKNSDTSYTLLFNSNDAATKVVTITANPNDTNNTDGNVDYVISNPGTVTVVNGDNNTITVAFGTHTLNANNGTVAINGYYESKQNQNVFDTLKADVLAAAGLTGVNASNYTVKVNLRGNYYDLDKMTGITNIVNWETFFLAVEVPESGRQFTITDNSTGVSKTVSMKIVDSRPSAGLEDTEITDVKVLNDQQGLTDYVNSLLTNSNLNPNGVTVSVELTEGSWPPAAAGVTTKLVYTVSYADDASYIGDSAKLTVYVQSAYNNCTVVADSTLTAGGSLTVSPSNDNTTVAGNDTVTITVTPSGDNVVETITVTKNGEAFATYTTDKISYNNKAATVSFKSDGSVNADVYTVAVVYSQSSLNLKADQTIVYCYDDKNHTYDLQKLVFDAIFGGSSAPMNKDNTKLEFSYTGDGDVKLWADVSKDPAINLGSLTHKFGESGSELIRATYTDAKYGKLQATVALNVFDSCYNVTVGVETVTNGANATIKTQYSEDARKYLGVNYFKQGTSLTVTLTPDGAFLDTLKQMYNGTYADAMAYIKSVTVYDKNGNVVTNTLTRDQGKLSLEGILQGVNPMLYNAAVTFDLTADEAYKVVVEYGILELDAKNSGFQMEMYKGGKDYAAKVPSAQELINAILGESEAAAFLATYGGAYTVDFSTDLIDYKWTAVSNTALLALNDGTEIKVRITWKPADGDKTYYPVADTANVTLVDLRTPTSVQGTVPTEKVEYVDETKLIAELKEALGLGILANGSAINVEYTVTYTITGDETNGYFATVTVTYDGSATHKPTSKTFENVPVADIPDNATIKVTIQNASDVVTNNDGKIMSLDPATGIYTVIGNGTYNFKFTPVSGKAIESVTVNDAPVALAYSEGVATFSMVLTEKEHYEIVVTTGDVVFAPIVPERPEAPVDPDAPQQPEIPVPIVPVEPEDPKDPENITIGDGIYNFAYGVQEPEVDIIRDESLQMPADMNPAYVTLQYLARAEGKVTVELPNIDLGFTVIELGTFDIELGELWLDPTAEVTEYDMEKLLDELVAEVIDKVFHGQLAANEAVNYMTNKLKDLTIGAHAFGQYGHGSVETMKISYTEPKQNTYSLRNTYATGKYNDMEVIAYVTIRDNRIVTEIAASDCNVTFGYSLAQLIAASGAQVTADGAAVSGLKIETNDLYLHANTAAQQVTLTFAGDENYQPSSVTINVIVNKAPASIDYDSQMITYGDAYDLGLVVSPTVMPDGTEAEIDRIELMIGLDMHSLLDVDFGSEDDEGNIDKKVGLDQAIAYIQLRLPESIRELPLVGQYLQGEFTLGEFTNLINGLSDILGIDEGSMDILNQVVEAITGVTDNMEIKIIVKDEDFHPTNMGVYIAGAVTIDSDFETAYTADYLIIAPKTIEAELAWDYSDSNGIMTLPVYQEIFKDLMGAHVVENDTMTGDVLNTANGHVKYLILGVNDETSEFLTTDIYGNIKANIWTSNEAINDNGAYVQIAYMLNWGNEIYYAMPIVRSFLIVPGTVDVELRGGSHEANNTLLKEFNNQPQGFNVRVTDNESNEIIYTYGMTEAEYKALINKGELTVTYIGLETNTNTYGPTTEKPVHAGAYAVVATYVEKDAEGNILRVGADAGVLVIEPTESTIEVGDVFIKHEDKTASSHSIADKLDIQAGSTVEGLTPDTTIIVGSIATDGDFSENGWDAVAGTVNVDFPDWVDEFLNEHAPDVLSDGITVGTLKEKLTNADRLAAYADKLAELGATEEVINSFANLMTSVTDVLSKMPEEIVLTFADTDTLTAQGIGAYVVVGIVTDSDHYPSVDAGILVIYPDVDQVYLKWNYEDTNGIFTRELLQYFDLWAKAYDDEKYTVPYTDKVVDITYQLIGIDANGDLVVMELDEATIEDTTLANGAYVEMAYVEFQIAGEMVISDLIARPVVILPNTVDVTIEGTNDNGILLREFDNQPQEIEVDVAYDGEFITVDRDNLFIYYAGVQTNGKTYTGSTAPKHAGAYVVTALYIHRDEKGNLIGVGADVATLVIEPTTATVEVEDKVVAVDGTGYDLTDLVTVVSKAEGANPDTTIISGSIATDGSYSENGWSAIKGNVNVDFPRWIDEIIAEYAPSVKDGITAGQFADLMVGKLPAISEKLAAEGIDATVIDTLNKAVEAVTAVIDEIPDSVTLSFRDNETVSNVGVYLVTAVVTDSDHYPAMDTGVLVITPNVTLVDLKWFHEDANGIWTPELLQIAGILDAIAYNKGTDVENEEATDKITYQFIGVTADGEPVIYTDAKTLPTGAYIEVAYIALELDGQMTISNLIARPLIVLPNTVDVTIVDANENDILLREFNNKAQDVEVKITYDGTALTPNDDYLTVYYTGVQTNGKTYNSTKAPKHAGAYLVTAVYVHRDADGEIIGVGADVATLIVTPTTSSVDVDSDVVTVDGSKSYTLTDMVHVSSEAEGAYPDATVITGTIATDGTYSENGWSAIKGNVNVDFPKWLDHLLSEQFADAYANGVSAADFITMLEAYTPDLTAKLAEMGANADVLAAFDKQVTAVTDVLKQMAANTTLTFKDDVTVTNVGVYLITAVVTDSDHWPSMDTGVLVITPDLNGVQLKWNENDQNGIITRINDMDLYATAYDATTGTVVDADATAKITYQFIGITTKGEPVIYNSADELPNGVYTEVAYIALEVDGVIHVSNLIARRFVLVANPVDVDFVDGGNIREMLVVEFDNTAKEMPVRVTLNDTVITPNEGELTVTYTGVQTNGQLYHSTIAPKHAGTYTVTATYAAYDEQGNLTAYGAEIGALIITPTTSTIEVGGKTVTYDGEGYSADVKASSTVAGLIPDTTVISGNVYPTVSGSVSEVGMLDALYSNVNIDFPEWIDEIFEEELELYTDGLSVAYLIDLVDSYRDNAIAAIPADELIELGVSEEKLNAAIAALNNWVDELIEVIDALPDNVTLTFEDDKTYTEPGSYLYYALVTDSDHLPEVQATTARAGVLTIEKMDMVFDLIDTTETWDGEEKFVDVNNEKNADYVTVVIDRAENTMTILIDEDARYLMNSLLSILDEDFDGDVSLSTALKQYSGAKVAAAMVKLIDEMEKQNLSDEVKAALAATKAELEKVNDFDQVTLNVDGALPTEVGEYEVYAVSYSQHYKTQASEGTLVIKPVQVEVILDDNSKVYGETDPELTYTVNYYDHEGNKLADAGVVTVVVDRVDGENVGHYAITATVTLPDDGSYVLIAQPTAADFEITRAEVTITVESATIACNGTEPKPSYSIDVTSGKVTAEELGVVITREEGNEPGKSYKYSVSYNESDNYIVTVTDNGAALTIKDHSYTAVVTDPTCEDEGYTTYTCSVCGDSYVADYVDAKGHDYDGKVTTEPTCSAEGVKTYTCNNDASHTYTEAVAIDADAHAWDEGKVTAEPTCTTVGVKTYTCAHNSDHTKTEEIAIDADAHAWNEGVVTTEPTCTTVGVKTYTCAHNSDHTKTEEIAIDADAHAWNEGVVTTEPTCTTAGVKTYTCKNDAGHTYTKTVEATGHTDAEPKDCVCDVCETSFAHKDENQDLVCDNCGTSLGCEDHTKGEEPVVENYVAPTCTEDGSYDNVYYCTKCGTEVFRHHVPVPATGHTDNDDPKDYKCDDCGAQMCEDCDKEGSRVIMAGFPATCTSAGLSDGYKCGKCDKILVKQEVIPALGHTEVTIPAVAATCTATGLTEGKYCSVCDKTLVAQVVVDALGHTAGETVVENYVAPTCIDTGSYDNVRYCTVTSCGVEVFRQSVTVPATGHVDNSNPKDYLCDDCGADMCKNCDDENSKTKIDGTAPTCTKTGLTDGWKCGKCSKILEAQTIIPATGHTAGEAVKQNEKAATCTKNGSYDLVVSCTVCNAEISRRTVTIPATGHKDINPVDGKCDYCGTELCTNHIAGDAVIENKVNPTCIYAGSYDTVVYCTKCNAELSRVTTTIPATGHIDNSNPKDYKCDICGEGMCDEHNYTMKAQKEPTCGATGSITYACTQCGDTYSITVAATGKHKPDNHYSMDDDRHYIPCTVCGKTTESGSHRYIMSGVNSEKKYCRDCGHTVGLKLYAYDFEDSHVSDALKKTDFDTAEKIKTEMVNQAKSQIADISSTNSYLQDVVMKDNEGNVVDMADWNEDKTWDGKLSVTIPAPTNIDLSKFTFHVSHMFASDAFNRTVGAVEHLAVSVSLENSQQMLTFTVTGLSPVLISVVCANNHANTEVRDAREATCSVTGYTGDTYCTTCGELIKAGTTIPTKNHTPGEPVFEDKAADGSYDEVVYCSVCGAEISRTRKSSTGVTYICWNMQTGVYYDDLGDALADARKDTSRNETIQMLAHHDQLHVAIPAGTTLDLADFTVNAAFVYGTKGAYITANAGTGTLKTESMVMAGEDCYVDPETSRSTLPVLVGETDGVKTYIFYVFEVTTDVTNAATKDRGLKIDEEAKEIYFQFGVNMSGAVRPSLSTAEGVKTTELSVVVLLEWENADKTGTGFQNFVYKADHVAQASAERRDYYLRLTGYDALNIDPDTLTVKAMIVTESFASASGDVWTYAE